MGETSQEEGLLQQLRIRAEASLRVQSPPPARLRGSLPLLETPVFFWGVGVLDSYLEDSILSFVKRSLEQSHDLSLVVLLESRQG